MSAYVIVRPGGRGHVTDDPHTHLVVDAGEWVQVFLKERDTYSFVSEHTSFDAAHNRRNELNGIDDRIDIPEQIETTVETGDTGVHWLGEKAA